IVPLKHLFDPHFLIESHAEDLSEHVLSRTPFILGVKPELDRATVYGLLRIGLVIDREAVWKAETITVRPQHLVGKGMESPTLHAPAPRIALRGPRYHLLSGPPGESKEQDRSGVDAAFHKVADAKVYHPCLAASRACNNEHGAFDARHGFVLCVIELLSHLLVHSIGDYNSK